MGALNNVDADLPEIPRDEDFRQQRVAQSRSKVQEKVEQEKRDREEKTQSGLFTAAWMIGQCHLDHIFSDRDLIQINFWKSDRDLI